MKVGNIVENAELGGLHHRYERIAAQVHAFLAKDSVLRKAFDNSVRAIEARSGTARVARSS